MDCPKCGLTFSRIDSRKRHEKTCSPKKTCARCGKTFSSPKNKRRHEKSCAPSFCCKHCGHLFDNHHNYTRHEECCAEPPPKKLRREPETRTLLGLTPGIDGVNEYETAFLNRLKSYFIRCTENYDLNSFCDSIKEKILSRIRQSVLDHEAIKFNMSVDCSMVNTVGDRMDITLKTKNSTVLLDSDVEEIVNKMIDKLAQELEETQFKKSGWSLYAVNGLRLKINKYNPLRGSTYIPLPKKIACTKSCINVQNTDEKCFKYSILAKFVSKRPERVSGYVGLDDKYNFNCISYPTPLNEIKLFERNNNISINVFGLDEKDNVYPLKVAKEELEDHRDLLLLDDGLKQHYVYIKKFETLVNKQITSDGHKFIMCKRCFSHFYNKDKLIEHKKYCNENSPVQVTLPTDKPFVEFEHVERAMKVPFVIYCDFESILTPLNNCKPDPEAQYSQNYQIHEAMSFCCYLKISDDVANIQTNLPMQPYIYRGKDAAKHLLKYLRNVGKEVSKIYEMNIPMNPLTREEEDCFNSTEKCYMCDKGFTVDDVKVRDHNHLTGEYRGAAHSKCNLRYRLPNFLPVLFHNLSGYDSHFIVRELGYDNRETKVIPNSKEKYISFSKSITKNLELRFIDTFRFMPSSLDRLVKNLPEFHEISKFFPKEQLPLLTRKGVFPFDYLTSWNVLEEKALPKKSDFYNRLNNSNISDEDYAHAQNVWTTFGLKNLGEYSDHYLKTDVLLLADVFETFRNVTLRTHKLDPCNYMTLPGLSWDAMLRFTGVRLELLTDYDMILMVERGIRGGICQVSHRYIQANNKYLTNYNPHETSTFITYQDCNNLYGYAMVQPLPFGEFEWYEGPINVTELSPEDEFGYVLDVDVDYPTEFHDFHNSLPFLAENVKINKQVKLVPHLNDRRNYVVHYLALKQALEHGLVLRKINRVVRFRQSRWLKPYIDHNTKLRTAACNDFEKDLYKLYNNSVFGKTMENVRKRLDIRLVCDTKKIEKLINRPDFIDRTIYNENLVAVHMAKRKLKFDKPLYVGLSVLDISKTVMYNYHYDVMLPKYGPERLILSYVDTDAFIYLVFTEDIYNDFKEMIHYLDTSDYNPEHPCYSVKNKKVLGKFKDEAKGQLITEFVGLRAKMYALLIDGHEHKKAKGVKTTVLKKEIGFHDYLTCLKENNILRQPMNFIRSTKHVITSAEVNKISLSPYDDKRIILKDGISTLAIGHYKSK